MDGQADTAPVSTDDLAEAFLADTSEETGDEEELQADDESPEQDTDESETEDDSPDDAEDESEAESAKDQTSGRKYKVTVKGEDGADLEQEVDEKELIAGYKRHADYTRKTQELAAEREQAVVQVRDHVNRAQQHYMQQTQLAQAAVMRLAGIRSPEEMAALAQQDPAGYVAEQARMQQVQGVLGQLQSQMHQEQLRAQQQQAEEMQKAFSRCWGVLGQKGIDKKKLQGVFETMTSDYGIPQERFANLSDPALVMVMHDAAAYRGLQKKKAEVTKKSEGAPRLPQKQNVPRGERQKKRLDAAFKSGRAGVEDLASMFSSMNRK